MKKIIFTFFLFAVALFSAQTAKKEPFVVVDGVVASNKFIKDQQKNVSSMHVYPTAAQLPASLKAFAALGANGIVEAKMKERNYDKIAFELLNDQFKLPSANPVYFDGFLIEDSKLEVLGNVLMVMEVKTVDGRQILDIRSSK